MDNNLPEQPNPVKPGFKALIARHHVALVERLLALVDPYELLVAIERHQRDGHSTRSGAVRFAMQFYAHFVSLAAEWLPADQDALVHVAKRVFRVTIPTLRRDLKSARMGVAS